MGDFSRLRGWKEEGRKREIDRMRGTARATAKHGRIWLGYSFTLDTGRHDGPNFWAVHVSFPGAKGDDFGCSRRLASLDWFADALTGGIESHHFTTGPICVRGDARVSRRGP